MGHSAGEVPAAYAAGLLTLEEAVGVVYHRSQEQQRLAGSGRMLAVGLSEAAGLSLLSANASTLQGVEIACVNSPSSIVFAGTEEQLTHVKALLPDTTFAVLVPGNIAFHCALTQPIVRGLKKRLAFLGKSQRKASLPFISTVTGDLFSGPAHADYWVDNVRHAVKFQQVRHCHPPPVSGLLAVDPSTLHSPLALLRPWRRCAACRRCRAWCWSWARTRRSAAHCCRPFAPWTSARASRPPCPCPP